MKVNDNLTIHVYPTEPTDKSDNYMLVMLAESLFKVDHDNLKVTYEIPDKLNYDDTLQTLITFSMERTAINYSQQCENSFNQSREINIVLPMDIYDKLFIKADNEVHGFLEKPIMVGEIPVYIYKRTDLLYYSRIDLDRVVEGRESTVSDYTAEIADLKLARSASEKVEFYNLERYMHIKSTFDGLRTSGYLMKLQKQILTLDIPDEYTCDYDKFMHIRKEEKE